jgi:hypothetical protein
MDFGIKAVEYAEREFKRGRKRGAVLAYFKIHQFICSKKKCSDKEILKFIAEELEEKGV